MEPCRFMDKSHVPEESEIRETLGRTDAIWAELKATLKKQFAPLTETWKFSGKNYGWTLQMKRKDRTVLYMTPCREYFRVSFAYGDKAVEAAQKSDLPQSILNEMTNAKKYAEGRPVRIEARNNGDIEIVKKLAEIKMAN